MSEIVIYTRQLCGFCSMAKRLLSEKKLEFTEHDATFTPELRSEMISKSGGASTFPQIFIGSYHVGGYTDLRALENDGKLNEIVARNVPS